jgi:hypothetical protein
MLTIAAVNTLLFTIMCLAQDQPPADQQQDAQRSEAAPPLTLTIAPGTRIALVLTQPIQSRYVRRGDDIYAQVTSPVNSGTQMAIPPGTFVQGTVDKLENKNGRGQLHLQSMSITFPDGYVAPIAGPITLETNGGYATKDPGSGRVLGAFALPMAGASMGAVIGHFAASSQSSTITSTLPPGCVGPPPGCLTASLTVPPERGKSTVIGAAIGGTAGFVASVLVLISSRHFFVDVGTPLQMELQQPLSLEQAEVADAIRQSEERPVATQPVAPRPVIPLPPPNTDHGTCYTPGSSGTPDTIIPGTPAIGGSPGTPSTVVPGIPPTPPTPYPCP